MMQEGAYCAGQTDMNHLSQGLLFPALEAVWVLHQLLQHAWDSHERYVQLCYSCSTIVASLCCCQSKSNLCCQH